MASHNSIGVSGLAACFPRYRVRLEDWCEWTNNSWPKISSVVGRSFRVRGPDQSVYTMAATAVLRLIRQYDIDPSQVSFLGFGTESSTDNSAGAIILKGMLDSALPKLGKPPLARSCEVPEFKHACLGGVYAMKGALRHLAVDGIGRQAIVVCADVAEYARGSSGEATQGAGAVAMLLETDPMLAAIDLRQAGSASDYRLVDFRKPMLRFCNQQPGGSHIADFPVFNGKYSTTCYVDETLHALDDMYDKRDISAIDHMRSLKYVFMHRPYQRMPENGWAIAYLFALSRGASQDKAELSTYARDAGVDADAVLAEMAATRHIAALAREEKIRDEAYPLTMAVLHAFRKSDAYRREVLDKLALGSGQSKDLGNLYTAALPAWLAAGFEQALNDDIELDGQELLTLGYGSGDAAEVIPFVVTPRWREATTRMRFSESLDAPVDLEHEQYVALHDGAPIRDLAAVAADEFVVDRIGQAEDRHFQDYGIEYYRYVGAAAAR